MRSPDKIRRSPSPYSMGSDARRGSVTDSIAFGEGGRWPLRLRHPDNDKQLLTFDLFLQQRRTFQDSDSSSFLSRAQDRRTQTAAGYVAAEARPVQEEEELGVAQIESWWSGRANGTAQDKWIWARDPSRQLTSRASRPRASCCITCGEKSPTFCRETRSASLARSP